MALEQSIREPLDFLQWRCYYIEDFNDKESVFIFKCHHSLADGVALVMMMCNLADNVKLEDIPKVVPKTSLIQNIIMHAILPLLVLYYSIES